MNRIILLGYELDIIRQTNSDGFYANLQSSTTKHFTYTKKSHPRKG